MPSQLKGQFRDHTHTVDHTKVTPTPSYYGVKKYDGAVTDAIPLTPTREELERRRKVKAKSVKRNLTMRTNVEYPPWVKDSESGIMREELLKNLSNRSRMNDDVVAEVDPQKFDAAWSKDKDFHVGPGGKGGIGNRYENVKRLITEGKKLPLPEVSIREDGQVGFVDGRHRFAVQRDMGHKKIHVAVDRESIQHIKPEHGIKLV